MEALIRNVGDKKWITHNSFWWAGDGVNIKDVKHLPEGDLVVGQLDPFYPGQITRYPVFKNPANIKTGTSLCKLGFPFHEIKTTFDDAKGFRLEDGSLPIPFFPIEGIYTRDVVHGKSRDGRYVLKYLETSTPGLRGQSGGPTFDVKGTIWAIQSRTEHLPLGFTPVINKDSKPVEEHQFLNAGLGVHPELITAFLTDNGINFNISDY